MSESFNYYDLTVFTMAGVANPVGDAGFSRVDLRKWASSRRGGGKLRRLEKWNGDREVWLSQDSSRLFEIRRRRMLGDGVVCAGTWSMHAEASRPPKLGLTLVIGLHPEVA